jgi:hypothetical protein
MEVSQLHALFALPQGLTSSVHKEFEYAPDVTVKRETHFFLPGNEEVTKQITLPAQLTQIILQL